MSKITLNLLNENELKGIKSCATYWNDIINRDENGTTDVRGVLSQELGMLIGRLGTKILWIVEEYALLQEENERYKISSATVGLTKPTLPILKSDVGLK